MESEYVYPVLPKDRLGQCWGGLSRLRSAITGTFVWVSQAI